LHGSELDFRWCPEKRAFFNAIGQKAKGKIYQKAKWFIENNLVRLIWREESDGVETLKFLVGPWEKEKRLVICRRRKDPLTGFYHSDFHCKCQWGFTYCSHIMAVRGILGE